MEAIQGTVRIILLSKDGTLNTKNILGKNNTGFIYFKKTFKENI